LQLLEAQIVPGAIALYIRRLMPRTARGIADI
jgi:hypothetical protein